MADGPRPLVRVLLIDDDEDDWVMTRDLLAEAEESRYSLDWASSYEQGLARIETREHDVYLMDYRLGAESGIDLLREAIARGCRAPIIMITGQGDRETDLAAMEAGAADYLAKSRVDGPLLERSIRYSIERARMHQLKDQMVAFVSHELRTPLAAVHGYAHLILPEADPTPELIEEAARAILVSSDRLARLIADFLDLSRLEAGRPLELVPSVFDLREAAEEAVALARAGAVRCTFSTAYGPGVGPLRADRDKVLQILINLLGNADKYSPGGGEVILAVEVSDCSVAFSVSDHGIGIPEAALTQLFTPFYRAPSAERAGIRGTGLGLHLCRRLAEAHGGTVTVESREGEGSTFRLLLPLGAWQDRD